MDTKEFQAEMDKINQEVDRIQEKQRKANQLAEKLLEENERLKRENADLLVQSQENYRNSGHVRFHKGNKNYLIKANVHPMLPEHRNIVHIGTLKREWFKNDDTWNTGARLLNQYMEKLFDTGQEYAGFLSKNPNSANSPIPDSVKDALHAPDLGRDTVDDAISRLFKVLTIEEQAEITAWYSGPDITAGQLLMPLEVVPKGPATMALRNRLRAFLRSNNKAFSTQEAVARLEKVREYGDGEN